VKNSFFTLTPSLRAAERPLTGRDATQRAAGSVQAVRCTLYAGFSPDANDQAYLHHNGKPVVAVWGIGFAGRSYTLEECAKLVDFLKNDKDYGGCTVMLGLPTYWQTLKNDSVTDPYLHDIVLAADIVSPWMVGRIRNTSDIDEFVYNRIWVPDIEWCKKYNKEYLPVVFPGFSWSNLRKDPKVFNMIPRLGGKFLWKQYVEAVPAFSVQRSAFSVQRSLSAVRCPLRRIAAECSAARYP